MSEPEDDDPQLRSLRAVWLALPDEEPPTRGLDALLAAARTQADEMAAPPRIPWWRRLLSPPMLALATLVLLLGGSLLLTSSPRSRSVAPSSPTVESAPAPAPAAVRALHQQSRAAAQRGDCATSRSLARKVESAVPSYYRDNVANDAPISKCLLDSRQ